MLGHVTNRNSPKGSPKGSTENLHVDKNSRSTTPSCDNENVDNKTTEVEIIDNEANINEPKISNTYVRKRVEFEDHSRVAR